MGQPSLKIGEILPEIKRLYIEAAPLIYYVEENETYADQMDLIVAYLENTPAEAVSSVITLTEVLTHPLRLDKTELVRQYRDILLNSESFRLVPVDAAIAETAANLRAQYNLRTPDALHIATAVASDCDAFLTNDLAIKRVTELRILILDDLELD
jgi:predicted nucleic acid-binding protein